MASSRPSGYMGIGQLVDPSVVYKLNFRWTFYLEPKCPNLRPVDVWFVKTAGRPSVSIDPIEMHFLNARTWIPGKSNIEAMTVTYLDVAAKRQESGALYAYLGAVYNFNNLNRRQGSSVGDYTARGTLVMYDGCGKPLEQWVYEDLWPTSYKFGDLAYDSNEVSTVEISFRYSQFTYASLCGNVPFTECCTGC